MRNLALLLVVVAACDAALVSPPDAAPTPDLTSVDKAAGCVASFGSGLTNAFGRLDGTLLAVVPPAHPRCALANDDHLVLEVEAGGAVYRMVVNVLSTFAGVDPRVRWASVDHALEGAPFAAGWHASEALDYVGTLGLHDDAFTAEEMSALVGRVSDALVIGAPVSVFATSTGGASAHLIHRNASNRDGAIVLDPQGTPRYWLFSFADQSF